MCKSKAAGGQRCASHNRTREAGRARREARAAVARRDELIADAASDLEIADARRDAARASAIAILSDPKLTSQDIADMCDCTDPQVEAEALPTVQAAVQAGKEAARLSGLAATERMFDRTDSAAQFEAEADTERSRMGRLVDAFLGNMHRSRWALADRLADLGDTTDTTANAAAKSDAPTDGKVADPEHGLLRSWFIDVMTEVNEAMTEIIVDSAAGLGITTPDPPAPTATTAAANTADAAPAAADTAPDQPAADTTDQANADTDTAADPTNDTDNDDDAEVGAPDGRSYEPDAADDPAHQDDDSDGAAPARPQATAPAATVGTPTAPTTPATAAPALTVSSDHTDSPRGAAASTTPPTAACRGSLADSHGHEERQDYDHDHDGEEAAMTFDPADLAHLSDAELLELITRLTQNSSAATTHGGELK